jgi:adenosine deaminase
MRLFSFLNVLLVGNSLSLALYLISPGASQAQSLTNLNSKQLKNQSSISRLNAKQISEQKTARYFESIRKSPPKLLAFLLKMPKGGDLHNHLSGAVYAESYIQWAAEKSLCVNRATMVLTKSPCDSALNQVTASSALSDAVLYRQMIDAWSMRYWQYSGQNGHDRFFDAFGKFGPANSGQTGKMLAEVASRAAKGHVIYLELMLTPDGGVSSQIGQKVGWNGSFENGLTALKQNGIAEAASAGIKALQDAEAEKNTLLKCGTPQEDAGCSVTIRYVSQVSRGAALVQLG